MPDVLVTEGSEELFTAVRRMAYLDAVHGPATALRKAAQKVIGDYSKALMDIRGKIDVKPVE